MFRDDRHSPDSGGSITPNPAARRFDLVTVRYGSRRHHTIRSDLTGRTGYPTATPSEAREIGLHPVVSFLAVLPCNRLCSVDAP